MTSEVEVVVGRIGRAHGIKGQVAIDLRTDEPARRFVPGASLQLDDGRELEVDTVSWHRGRLLLTFAGVPDRTAVEALRGRLLSTRVPADEQPSEPEEFFDRQLVGMAVLDHAGQGRGIVKEVLHLPAQDVLLVELHSGGEAMVPFVSALVPEVDVDARTVTLADVGGLLEAQ